MNLSDLLSRLLIKPWLLLCLLLPCLAEAGTLSIITTDRRVSVGYIYDGDTFRTTKGERIRLLGINTPEVAHNRQPGQVMGHAATLRLQQLISGKTVRLSFDTQRRDDYGRTLAQVHLMDNSWVNRLLVREGLAHVYTFEPNHHWTSRLLAAERLARSEKLGIWSTSRFRALTGEAIKRNHIGQFRIVSGSVKKPAKWSFMVGHLHVTIPKKYRRWFAKPLAFKPEQHISVRGIIRFSRSGNYYLAVHSPFDIIINHMEVRP
ncbi:MAG: thermonuclease family protein [Mariprofundus sp.]